jgi:hypothetical protein
MSEAERQTPSRRQILAAAVCAVVLAAGFIARSPIVDAVTGKSVSGISFHYPAAYALFAPVSDVFDALTLLSLPQVFSTFGFVCVAAAALRFLSVVSRRRRSAPAYRVRDHLRLGANVAGAIVGVAGLALVMARPMSAIAAGDRDLVTIDFHSHTSASHDGRPQFTPDENREWHRRAGFDVAYITDHHTFAGAAAAWRANPQLAGEGTVLLPGLEYLDGDEHVLALGLDPRTTNPTPREWHPLYSSTIPSGARNSPPPLLILSLPGDLDSIPADEQFGVARLAAVELSDGSPRGMEQAAGSRNTIMRVAKEHGLAFVSGSDNHGWGKAAPAWTVMRIRGWRTMTPAELDVAIRSGLLARNAGSATVISRRLPPAASPLGIAFTGPELAWEIFRDIGWYERFSWIGWCSGGWALALVAARRRSRKYMHHHWSLPELVPRAASDSLASSD